MKKVLIINTIDYILGGMSTVIFNYYLNVDRNDIEMDFVVNDRMYMKYKKLLENKSKTYNIDRRGSTKEYFFDLLSLIKKERYDIVHVHGNSCTMSIDMLAARLGGCRHIIAHSHNSTCEHMKAHKILRPVFELCCDERIACSELAGKWLFHNKNFHVLQNAMNIKEYEFSERKRDEFRKSLGIKDDEFVLGHVGYFNEQKNHSYLIELMKSLVGSERRYKLLLVGEGDGMKDIKSMVSQYGLTENVIFFGTTEDVSSVMSAMDMFLFPSKWEGLGIVIVEAQLSGLPCIASNNVPEETKISEKCEYISLSSIDKWIDCIEKTTRDNVLIQEIAERYDIKKQAVNLERIYNELLS